VTCDNILLAPLARKSRLVRVYNGTKQVERVSIEKLGKRGFTVVFVGRLVREKDIGTLIKAVKIAREQVPGLELWLVGDGDDRKLLEAEAAELQTGEYVRFWGQQTETAQFFSAADVFAMSSISEGLPMSLLESMSLGTPAILTDVDGMGEVLRLTGSGMLVPVGDPQAFAEAIVRMAQDEGVREGFRAKALKAYAEQFTLERMADGYMELYRTRVAGGKST
jgi:glycosyltransferase involved in cell wall biosynthesis